MFCKAVLYQERLLFCKEQHKHKESQGFKNNFVLVF